MINFYDSSEGAQAFNKIFELAHEKFTELEEKGEIVNRDVGWFNCNVEEHPELKLEHVHVPNQVITPNSLLMKKVLHFHPLQDEHWISGDIDSVVFKFVDAVWTFSGNWLPEATCDDILHHEWEGGKTLWDVIYFGSEESLGTPIEVEGHEVDKLQYEELVLASMVERYEYHHEMHTGFHVNSDPECAVKVGLDPEKPAMMLLVREDTFRKEPYFLTGAEPPYNAEVLLDFINVSIVRSLPRWSRRAYDTVTDGKANAIILLLNDLHVDNVHGLMKDPRYVAFTEIVELTQHYDTGTMGDLIPVMTTLEHEDLHGVPQLITLLGIDEGDEDLKLPQFYLYHGRSNEVTPFPYTFTEGWAPSAEYVHLWAIQEALK